VSRPGNCWLSYRDPVATWVVELPSATPSAGLLGWLEGAVVALEEAPLARVESAPEIGYRRERDGALWPRLRARAGATGTVDLFSFSGYGPVPGNDERFRTSGSVAWFEDGPEPVRALVDDLGALLERLRPNDVEAAAGGFMIHLPPVWVRGPRVEPGNPGHDPLQVRVHVHSDLWLPWVPGILHEHFEAGSWFDNRPLATLHTPDLNSLLARLRELALAAGGTMTLDEDDTWAVLREQVDDVGVILDLPPPGAVHEV